MKKELTYRVLLVVGVTVFVASLFFAGESGAQQVTRLSMGTGGTGGVFYIMGGGIARILTKYMPNTEVTVEVTAGSVDNCKLLKIGKADLGLSGADICIDAADGVGKFGKGSPEDKIAIRSLGAIYTNHMHFITHKDSPIRTVYDVKGKRVSTGSPGSGIDCRASSNSCHLSKSLTT